jgi:hypothetical protein
MESPVVRCDMLQRVYGEIDALTNPHARGTGQPQSASGQIAAGAQLVVEAGIVFRRQGPRQILVQKRNIFPEKKSGRRRVGSGAGQIVEDTA